MDTQVDILLADEDMSVTLGWQTGDPPEQNDEMIADLWGLPDTMVIPSFGETSLIIAGGPDVDFERVCRIFHLHGYETLGQAVI